MMNTTNLLLCFICLSLLSCRKDETPGGPVAENCTVNLTLKAPTGFELTKRSTVNFNGGLSELQFVDDQLGFLLGRSTAGSYAALFKTVDGGSSWTDLGLTAKVNPINLFFMNDKIGFITYYEATAGLLKTTDGGQSWTPLTYPDLVGNLYHLQKDEQGNLYAIASNANTSTVLVKSTDQGATWKVIHNSPELGFSLITFSFKIVGSQIYASGKNGKILVTDLDGKLNSTLQTPVSGIWDLAVIDPQHLVVAGTGQTIKSVDGGTTWQTIYDRSGRLLDFVSTNEGLMILNKSYCDTDVYQANDVLGYTSNGGTTWQESAEATNTLIRFVDSQPISGSLIFVIGNDVYALRR